MPTLLPLLDKYPVRAACAVARRQHGAIGKPRHAPARVTLARAWRTERAARAALVSRITGRVAQAYAPLGLPRVPRAAKCPARTPALSRAPASPLAQRAAQARATAALTGWTRDLYRSVALYHRACDAAMSRRAPALSMIAPCPEPTRAPVKTVAPGSLDWSRCQRPTPDKYYRIVRAAELAGATIAHVGDDPIAMATMTLAGRADQRHRAKCTIADSVRITDSGNRRLTRAEKRALRAAKRRG